MNASVLARSLLRTSLAAVVLAAATAATAEEIPEGPVASSGFNLAPGSGVLVGPVPAAPVPQVPVPQVPVPQVPVPQVPVPQVPVPQVPVPQVPVPQVPVPQGTLPGTNFPAFPSGIPGGVPAASPFLLGFQGMDVGWGVRIVSVNKSGMAVKMGLEPGDVIVQVNGQRVLGLADYHAVMAASGGVVQLLVRDVRSGGIYLMPAVTVAPAGGMAGAVAGL